MEIEFDATQAMESRRDRAEETRRALQDEIDAADAACAAKVIADLEAKLGMPWQQATTEQLRGAGCVNVRDVIAGLPEDEQSEIERQVAELKTHLDDPVDCSDIPETTDETRLVMARDRRDAEGRLIREMRSTSE